MAYMARHGMARARPAELVPGTLSVITARMDYLPQDTPDGWQALELSRLQRPGEAVVSLYARGRDYHKVLRARLQKLAERIGEAVGPLGHRVFTDSAPVLEAELAVRSGQGWRGKHTLVLNREGGSMFFLGEIYVDLALPPSEPVSDHCGACTRLHRRLPHAGHRRRRTELDARRCISYLTIEHAGAIPEALRPLMGNRIYGCDDCQLVCPWNKYAAAKPPARLRSARRLERCHAGGAVRAGPKPSSCAAPKAARSGASATSAGNAISRSPWATPCASCPQLTPNRCAPRWRCAPTTRARWCANTCVCGRMAQSGQA